MRASVVWVGLLVASGAAAQEAPRSAPAEGPAAVNVEALKYGAVLEEQAPEKLRNWVRGYVRTELHKETADTGPTVAQVEKNFASYSPATRDAIVYLTFYRAYRDADSDHQIHAKTLSEIDRERREVEDRFRFWEEQFRFPPPGSSTGAQREAQLNALAQRREQLENRRRLAATAEAIARRRVDSFLRLLNGAIEKMDGIPPEVLRDVLPMEKTGTAP